MADHTTGVLSIECGSCPVRGVRCDDCMVTALEASRPPEPLGLPLDADERAAVAAFVRAGLVSEQSSMLLRAHPRRGSGRIGRAAG